ncbi:MAG: hypothetical protein J7K75_07895 [Desulfuromonas sp.]|nr:hypothetical protein [Desulfuromonas sp.]
MSGVNFSADGLGEIVTKLVDVQLDEESDLVKVIISKELTSKVSDNEIVFTVDGRESTVEELEVIEDDPILAWKFRRPQSDIPSFFISQNFASDIDGAELVYTKDAAIIKMPVSELWKMTDVRTAWEAYRNFAWSAIVGRLL